MLSKAKCLGCVPKPQESTTKVTVFWHWCPELRRKARDIQPAGGQVVRKTPEAFSPHRWHLDIRIRAAVRSRRRQHAQGQQHTDRVFVSCFGRCVCSIRAATSIGVPLATRQLLSRGEEQVRFQIWHNVCPHRMLPMVPHMSPPS